MLYPLTFQPIFKERLWGGRQLEALYHKPLPPAVPIGESWEISDRPGDVSIVANGPLAGKELHWLMQYRRTELLGSTGPQEARFPLLIKILDAREKLSLQVHPPSGKAAALGGEPKTEMWYIAHAERGAELYVGLKYGTSRHQFEEQLLAGTVERCFHRVPVRSGDTMFLPSGRVHAIGAGLVIFEVQQNSDTTYRVFDWNRVDRDGKPRQLHVAESLASIDFNDFEPALQSSGSIATAPGWKRWVSDPLFVVDSFEANAAIEVRVDGGSMQILGVVTGTVVIRDCPEPLALAAGHFCLVPASLENVRLRATAGTKLLKIQCGR